MGLWFHLVLQFLCLHSLHHSRNYRFLHDVVLGFSLVLIAHVEKIVWITADLKYEQGLSADPEISQHLAPVTQKVNSDLLYFQRTKL